MVLRTWIKSVLIGSAVYATRYITFWFIVGSLRLFFSGITITGPLVGLYGTFHMLSFLSIISCIRFSLKAFIAPSLISFISVYHIPTQLAAWYWKIISTDINSKSHLFVRIVFAIIPLACMGIFAMHPVGRLAIPYTFYWFIPCAIAIWAPRNRWLHALGSTFMAHACGSVFWLFNHPNMTSELWLSLIPGVACERFLIATAMWSCSYIVDIAIEVAHKMVLRCGRVGRAFVVRDNEAAI